VKKSGARNVTGSARRRPSGPPFSGWTGLVLGLALGAVGATVVLRYKTHTTQPPAARPAKPAPMSAREENAEKDAVPGTEYTFYDKLKNFEVVIPEKDKEVHRDLKPAPETRPGTYILQAGSYRNLADAERVRAQLHLAGIEAKVQKVTVDADTWHRVRVGPVTSLEELNRLRARLRQSDVDALVIRVGD
jgi:cell division protein FtsN